MESKEAQASETGGKSNPEESTQLEKPSRPQSQVPKAYDAWEYERGSEGDPLNCLLCQEEFLDPKLLPCLHTFCKSCLLKLVQENPSSKVVSCPICKDDSPGDVDIETLIDNVLVASLQDRERTRESEASSDTKGTFCTSCSSNNPATCRCTNCNDFLCETCTLSHRNLKVLRLHKLIEITEWKKQTAKASTEEKFCPIHYGEHISFFCDTCKKLVCKDCADLYHKKPHHAVCSLLEGAVICRRKVDKLLTISRQTEAKFKGAWEIVNGMKSELTETSKSLRDQVGDAFQKERELLEAREKGFLSQVDVIESQREEILNTYMDKIESILKKLWTACDMTESLLDNGDDFHMLSLETVICSRLQALYKCTPELPSSDLTFIDLGEGQEQESDDEPDVAVSQPEAKEQEGTPQWELETTVGDRGSGKGQFDWCKGVSSSLDDHTVVADWGNDRVQVFDASRRFLCVLNVDKGDKGRLSMPHDVACLLDGRFIVVDKSSFAKVYGPNGQFLYRFSTRLEDDTNSTDVELSCVAIDRRSRILIGDCKRNLVTFHYVDGKIIKSVPAVAPEHIATTSKDLLVVSCPRKQKVRVMNHDGRFMFQIEYFGSGEKLKPRGVACDNKDNIYVVHKERGGEKSVHVFSSTGKYIACVAKHLSEPYDVDIAPGGNIVVSDDDAIKVFKQKN